MTRDFEWLRSSFCRDGSCVEVFWAGGAVNVRDSKLYPASPIQRYDIPEWTGLIAAIKAYASHIAVDFQPSGHVVLGFTCADRHELLTFTAAEWHAFELGVRAGEFDIDKLSSLASTARGSRAGSAGEATGASPGRAATGAGALAGLLPAPVAAESDLGLLPVKPLSLERPFEVRAGQDLAPPAVTPDGASEPVPAGGSPSGCGPNGSEPIVPAGRPSPVHPTQVSPPQEAVRPGPGPFVPTDLFAPAPEEAEELAAVLGEARRWYTLFGSLDEPANLAVARYLLAAGYVRAAVMSPPEVTEHCREAADPAWGSGPLVEHISDTESSGVDGDAGRAGPGLPPVSPGPADCLCCEFPGDPDLPCTCDTRCPVIDCCAGGAS